jgi:predicted MPP superfamily phosphohydrolase
LGNFIDLASPRDLVSVALANSIVLVAAYLAVAALVWAFADATMPRPRDFVEFPASAHADHTCRIAHLSDIHVVGERYGFRIESGRAGPRGNERLNQLLALLDVIHANNPLDTILVTGDMTDAGRSAEWSELLDALMAYPQLAERFLILPGNHDLNIVDRANPARLDLHDKSEQKAAPTSVFVGCRRSPWRARSFDRSDRTMSGLQPFRGAETASDRNGKVR